VDIREVLNAIFYLNRTGCQWRALPHDFPHYTTVYYYYKQWREDGTWDKLLCLLREQVRQSAGKEPTPSMVIIDSQSVKTAGLGGEHGIDGNKKVNGRKRHILVDTLGLVVAVLVTSAAVLDGQAAPTLMEQLQQAEFPRLEKVLGDNAYGKCGFPGWVNQHGYYVLEISDKAPDQVGFKVIRWRWVVERTFAWLGRCRRHSKDYEKLTASSRAMLQVSSIGFLLNRIKPKQIDPQFRYPKKAA
jgi:putative transposase